MGLAKVLGLMAWSTTDWTPGNIQAYADEFWLAIDERCLVAGLTRPPYLPVSGANIHSGTTASPDSTTGKFSWRWIQDWINPASNGYKFLRSHNDDGTLRGAGFFNDEYAGYPTLYTAWELSTLLYVASGGKATNWRRATVWPNNWEDWDDPVYSSGVIQEGDIFGPWICKDIQDALNLLIHTNAYGDSYACEWKGYEGFCSSWEDTPAEAIAIAENDWHAAVVGNQFHSNVHTKCTANYGWDKYKAHVVRSHPKARVSGLYTGKAVEVDFYWLTHGPGAYMVFDDQDDGVLEYYLKFHETISRSAGAASTFDSSFFMYDNYGDLLPNWWTTYPYYWSWRHDWYLGYDITSPRTVERWNVTGGLDYQ